jgi:dCMP deaminase
MGRREKWDWRFLELAALIATWSKDLGTQVGAVIVDRNNRIIATGYNGFPAGVNDAKHLLEDRETKLLRTIHAEENALLFARGSVEGCTLFLTHQPCANCMAKVIQAGIRRVVFNGQLNSRWHESLIASGILAGEAGVVLERYDLAAIKPITTP